MIGGIEETSASFEARTAPRSYPTWLCENAVTWETARMVLLRSFEINATCELSRPHSLSEGKFHSTVSARRLVFTRPKTLRGHAATCFIQLPRPCPPNAPASPSSPCLSTTRY